MLGSLSPYVAKIDGEEKAAAEGAFRCGNLDCNATGSDKVNQMCAACCAV